MHCPTSSSVLVNINTHAYTTLHTHRSQYVYRAFLVSHGLLQGGTEFVWTYTYLPSWEDTFPASFDAHSRHPVCLVKAAFISL